MERKWNSPVKIDDLMWNMTEFQKKGCEVSPPNEEDGDLFCVSDVAFSKKMVLKVLQKSLRKGEITAVQLQHTSSTSSHNFKPTTEFAYRLNPLYKKNKYAETPFILCMDASRRTNLFVFSSAQEVSHTLRIPAKAIYAVCQGRERSTHGIAFRWFHPDDETYPDHLVSAARVRRDFMMKPKQEALAHAQRDTDGDEEIEVVDDDDARGSKRARGRAATKTSSQPRRKKNRLGEESFDIKGKANVPIKKTAMTAVSTRTGRTRKLTYHMEYAYEGGGFGVGNSMMQAQVGQGKTRKGPAEIRTNHTSSHVYKERKSDKYVSIDATTHSVMIDESQFPAMELCKFRSYVGSTFINIDSEKRRGDKSRELAPKHYCRVTALCVNKEVHGVLFFKFYSLLKYPKRCPLLENQYEFIDCRDMVGEKARVEWVQVDESDENNKDKEEDASDCNSDSDSGRDSESDINSDGDSDSDNHDHNHSSSDISSDSDNENNDELNSDGNLKRPNARYLFASRVFEAAQVIFECHGVFHCHNATLSYVKPCYIFLFDHYLKWSCFIVFYFSPLIPKASQRREFFITLNQSFRTKKYRDQRYRRAFVDACG